MKKGLILALTMVAMVALVLPVSAIAPVIDPLPGIIIGDAGDVSGTDPNVKHLFRYTNIMNIADSDKIEWKNVDLGFGNDQKHAYYMSSPAGAIQASTDARLVTEVNASDIAAMQTAGTRPAAAKEITDKAGDGGTPDFFWLSLANNMSSATNAYTATAAANGRLLSEYTTLDPAVVTLVLADGDFPTTAVAQADFTVYTVAGSEDGFSGAGVGVYEDDFANNQSGWFWKGGTAGASLANHAVGAGGLLISRASTSGVYFGEWTSGNDGTAPATVVPVDGATQAGNVLRATFTLTSTATNAADTPGYRLFYMSEGFTHLGGLSMNSTNSIAGSSVIAPTASANLDAIVYWAVPFDLNEYGDTGKLATLQAGKDFRDYFLTFDMIGYEGTDTGVLGLLHVNVEMIARPDGTNMVSWGTGNTYGFASDLAVSGWNLGTQDYGAGLGDAPTQPTANQMQMKGTAGSAAVGYRQVGPFANATVLPAWQSGKLIRSKMTLAASALNTAPTFRMLTLAVKTDGNPLSILWVDSFTGDIAKTLYAPESSGAAAPKVAGSVIETYVWTHTAGTGSDSGVLEPQVDCYAAGQPIFTQTSATWPIENATLTLTKYQYEACN